MACLGASFFAMKGLVHCWLVAHLRYKLSVFGYREGLPPAIFPATG